MNTPSFLSFEKSIELMRDCIRSHKDSFTKNGLMDVAQEALNKIVELQELRNGILELHHELTAKMVTSGFSVVEMLKDHAKNDPKLAEWFEQNPNIALRQGVVAYPVSAEDASVPVLSDAPAAKKLRQLTNSYYYTAHRIIKIFEDLPFQQKLKCKPITIVRNKLLEHPAKGDSFDSFAYSTSEGPQIKGLRKNDQKSGFTDSGFRSNNNALVTKLEKTLASGLRP